MTFKHTEGRCISFGGLSADCGKHHRVSDITCAPCGQHKKHEIVYNIKNKQQKRNDAYTYRQNKGHDMCLYKGLDNKTKQHINNINTCNSKQTNKTKRNTIKNN